MKETSLTTLNKAMVFKNMQMGQYMKENLKIIKKMEKVNAF